MVRRTHTTDYCAAFCRLEDRNECAYWTGCTKSKCGDAQIYDRLAAIEDILGDTYDLDHLREIVEAEKEGRLVVLPCKVGDTVYIPHYTKGVVAARVQGISVSVSGRAILRFGGYPFESAWGDGCGKDWFLTREEAEVVLRGGDGG